jgi:hypothetical protein
MHKLIFDRDNTRMYTFILPKLLSKLEPSRLALKHVKPTRRPEVKADHKLALEVTC